MARPTHRTVLERDRGLAAGAFLEDRLGEFLELDTGCLNTH